MFGMGMGELIIILVVALLALGPEKLPEAAKKIGQTIRGLRRQTSELRKTIEEDTQLGDAMREIRSALNEDVAEKPKPKPPAASDEDEDETDETDETSDGASDSDASDSDDEVTVQSDDEAVARDDSLGDEGNANGTATPNGSKESAEAPAPPLSEYERYIHMWGAQAAADKYGTTLAHAEATLKATLNRGQNG